MTFHVLNVYRATPGSILARDVVARPVGRLDLLDLDEPRIGTLAGSVPGVAQFIPWLRAGYRGLLLAENSAWVCVGWLATPASPPPVHLRNGGAYWIFNCHTRADRRGEGHYQRMLVGLVQLAARLGCADEEGIFVDALASNAPAVAAIERVGFRRVGTIIQVEISRLGLRLTVPIGLPRNRTGVPGPG